MHSIPLIIQHEITAVRDLRKFCICCTIGLIGTVGSVYYIDGKIAKTYELRSQCDK